jgi:alginate O-acetyltransferase complex protein AlgI
VAFNSLQFLAFFPLVVVGFFLLPHRVRSLWLLAASLYFCGAGQPLALVWMLAATVVTYWVAIKVDGAPDKPRKKAIMKMGVALLVANLVVFKYTSFVNESFRSVAGWFGGAYPVPVIHLLLPIGISFYTFLLIGYLVDVSNGLKAERSFGTFALFVTYFPKLVAGPIERAKNLLPQLHVEQTFDYRRVVSGLVLMALGFFKKVVVGDRLAPFVQQAYGDPRGHDGVVMVLATWMFAFQVYCDFSGYTDIAIGAARTMGYKLINNFNRPYFAISIADYWKRWHISLSSWLTDYVYTPLTRTKAIKMKWYYLMLLSLFITFVVSGFWHGAQWTFVVWGVLHGTYMITSMLTQKWRRKVNQSLGLDRRPRLHNVLRVMFTFCLVCFAYIWFQAASVADAVYISTHLHTGWGHAVASAKDFLDDRYAELAFALYGIAVVMIADTLAAKGDIVERLVARPARVRWAVYYTTAVSIILLGAFYDTQQKFIYFQF